MYNIEDVQKKKSVTLTGVVGPDPVKGESDKLPKPWLSSKISNEESKIFKMRREAKRGEKTNLGNTIGAFQL